MTSAEPVSVPGDTYGSQNHLKVMSELTRRLRDRIHDAASLERADWRAGVCQLIGTINPTQDSYPFLYHRPPAD